MDNEKKLTQLRNLIAAGINSLSLEGYYGNIPDWLLADHAIEALFELKRVRKLLLDYAKQTESHPHEG